MGLKRLVRKWNVTLRRRRLRKEQAAVGSYKVLEQEIAETGQSCMNCKVPLTGPFCHICGQKDDDLRRPFWTFLREMLDNTFSVDSKLLKSLILLVIAPGGLTRAYLMGRRARFVPPLRLYLVASLSFFLILKLFDILILDINVTLDEAAVQRNEAKLAGEQGEASSRIDAVRARIVAQALAALDKTEIENLSADEIKEMRALAESDPALKEVIDRILVPGAQTEAQEEPAKQDAANQGGELGAAPIRDPNEKSAELKAMPGDSGEPDVVSVADNAPSNETPDENTKEAKGVSLNLERFPYKIDVDMFVRDTGEEHQGLRQEDIDLVLENEEMPDFAKNAWIGMSKVLKNPEEFNDLLNDWLPIALFVLMPFFALLTRLFHWGKNQYYMNHLVFSLHFHSFLFLLLSALILVVPRYGGEFGFSLLWWGASAHLFIALKVGFDQGWIRSFFKAGFIWVIYLLVMQPVLVFAVIRGLQDL